MNEQIFIYTSEINLAAAALYGIAIVVAASWYDFRAVAQKKRMTDAQLVPKTIATDIPSQLSIHLLPIIFINLSRIMIRKVFAWRKPGSVVDEAVNYNLLNTASTPQAKLSDTTKQTMTRARLTINILFIIGTAGFISMLTYFFYTAATLQSNILLTLSWVTVSLWLVAILWSNNLLALSKKIELTWMIPFMYFVFYALSFALLAKSIKGSLRAIPLPRIDYERIYDAVRQEAYSTRF